MALSYIDYTGDGSTTDYTLPFPYIDQSHVHVYVNGLEITSFTWLSATQIRLTVAPLNTFSVRIKRITPNTARLVDFQNGSALDADVDLDRDSNQMFFITQELVDSGVSGTTATSDQFTGNGTNTVYALTSAPTTGSSPVVTVNGVTATQGVDYTISGQTLTFTSAVPAGAIILVTYTTTASTSGSSTSGGTTSSDPGTWTYDVFTGDGTTTGFVLKAPPGNTAVMDVAVSGLTKLPGTDYLLSGQAIQFLSAPANGAPILVRYGAPLPATAVSMITEFRTATAGQTVFGLTSTYQPGTGTMMVFVNGLVLVPGVDFTETDSATVTIGIVLYGGDSVLFVYGNPINTNTVDGSRVINNSMDGSKLLDSSVSVGKLSASLQSQLSTVTVYTGEIRMFGFKTPPTGWISLNGGTIGDGASGATTRANADTQALFTALWNDTTNTELAIQDSSGSATTRGASAALDFAAHKRLPIPDGRGEFMRGWDNSRGVDSGRAFLSWQADQLKAHTHTYTGPGAGTGNGFGQSSSSNTTGSTGGNETRPRNLAVNICIKL